MAHLYKKVKKGHEYFYIRETQRVYGKPTTINQVYLGTADKVEAALGKGGFSPKEFGSIFALNELDKSLDLAGIVNEILPPKKRTKGPSLGELVYYAAINRAICPTSKRQLASWYETTDIQRIRPLRLESLNSQNFWNHWDRISDIDLEKITVAFFKKVNSVLPSQEKQLVIEATEISPSPRPSAASVLGDKEDEDLAEHLPQQKIGLALVTDWQAGVPVYSKTYPDGLPKANLYENFEHLLQKVADMETTVKDATILLYEEMDSEMLVGKIDARENLHFIGAYPAEFATELTKVSLKDFRPLAIKADGGATLSSPEDEKILYYETQASFWGRPRRVIVTFDPKVFHKSYQDLGKKVQRVRKELLAWQQKSLQGDPSFSATAVEAHLAQMCQRLKIAPELFQLTFQPENERGQLEFQLDHHQMAGNVRQFGKNILVTDREDWSPVEIYETSMKRSILGPQVNGSKPNQGRMSGNNKDARSYFQMALMPLYHWTDSKIRVHLFVCVVALTYLTLLCQRLAAGGMPVSPREAMDEMRSLRTAIYLNNPDGKLRRMLDRVSDKQAAMLQVLGYKVDDGRVVPV
jgi:transposase